MLIYVNKKKEKYKKIKILSLIFCCILIFVINLSCFKKSIHTPLQNLTQYHSLKIPQNWYDNAQTATIFTNKKSSQAVIVIPAVLNKENFIITAAALYKTLTPNTEISFTKEVKQTELLQKITKALSLKTPEQTNKNLLITTDFNQANSLIFTHKLYPHIINYKQAEKVQFPSPLQTLSDTVFPKPASPQSRLDKDKLALETFAKDYAEELKNLISSKKQNAFFAKNIFLQNARICLQNKNKTSCRTSTELSLEKNLTKALNSFSQQNPPQKLIFLTSEQKIKAPEPLNPDEGVRFRFGSKEAILLPQNISALANPANAFYILKKHAGLNPDYTSPDMNFYKFKTMEINLNDDI